MKLQGVILQTMATKVTCWRVGSDDLTNYSLSTSYSYDTSHFSSPAFTASPSGSTLTGGAN